MKVSILGCGWLGKALGSYLAKKGFTVSGSTTREERFPELSAVGIKPFLINLDTINSDQTFFLCEVLIIAIPPRMKTGGVENYVRQLMAARESILNSGNSRVILISSTSVYPDLNRTVTEEDADESFPLVRAEHIFRDPDSFTASVLRFGGLVGPDRHPGKFLAGKKNISGANNPVNIIHQEDCIQIIEAIMLKEKWNETFNACADQHPSKKDFYSHASRLLQLNPPEFSDEPAPFKIVSSEKLKKALSYQFQYPDPLSMFS